MARRVTVRRMVVSTVAAWFFGGLIFFPILWMVLTSFKTELEAFADTALVPVLRMDDGELRHGAGAQRLFPSRA